MAEDSGTSYLVGGALALMLAPILVLAYMREASGDTGSGWAPSAGQLSLWLGTAALGGYLIAASAFWTSKPSALLVWMRKLAAWPFLALLAGFMFTVRMIPYQSRLDPTLGRVYFAGSTDPFYHFRAIFGIVRNFPFGPRWDPWTFYPQGTGTGQFGTLFDWIPAAWIVIRHGRDASEYDIAIALSIYTVIIGTIIIVPFFFLAKKLFGTIPAVVSSITLALMPGGFLAWGLATAGDHHGAEALGSVISMLGVYWAAERAHGMRGLIQRGASWSSMLPVGMAGLMGGVALATNMLLWPPALLFAAVLTAWLTVCILIENAKEGGDARGLTAGGAIALAVAGLIMLPVLDTTFLGEFNSYGLLHVVSCLFAAAWLVGVHFASRLEARLGWNPWTVPGAVVGAAIAVFLFVRVFVGQAFTGIAWGLSWISGIGTPRTTATIGEARATAFFCTQRAQAAGESCLSNDYGLLPGVTFLILLAVIGFAIWKRDRGDILLAIWSFVIFRAVDTQARFGYYLAVVMALLLGWLVARLARVGSIFRGPTEPVKQRGTKKKRRTQGDNTSVPLQAGAAILVLLLVLPGNVFASDRTYPSWTIARAYSGSSFEMSLWLDGLDWMQENTPDAGVDLAEIYERPPAGERFDYAASHSYGVLSWWDYGHWIETWGERPPVANPFQQAAPFASVWFTEQDPAMAEKRLASWESGNPDPNGIEPLPGTPSPPIRYVWIDEAMSSGKYGAITVWAHAQNDSRPPLVDPIARRYSPEYMASREINIQGKPTRVTYFSEFYTDTMMSRLYDRDGEGLSHYRLVYEHPSYVVIGNVAANNGASRCLRDAIGSNDCPVKIEQAHLNAWRNDPTSAVTLGDDAHLFDVDVVSRLKLFERVEGAHLTGTVAPGAEVVARVQMLLEQPNGATHPWEHRITVTADENGDFDIVWPYPTTDLLAPAEGGTRTMAFAQGPVVVRAGALAVEVPVGERAVLDGLPVPVAFV